MKRKPLWLAALSLTVICAWAAYNYVLTTTPKSIVGISSGAVVFTESGLPVLHWGEITKFGDLGLKIKSQEFLNLTGAELEQRVRYNDMSYTQIQAGLFLVILNGQRIFLMTEPFEPQNLEVTQAVDFESDWVVLQRSSLLPSNWPEPSSGWVVLGSQMSDSLKERSLAAKKPVVRPERGGTVWLEKTSETNWMIIQP